MLADLVKIKTKIISLNQLFTLRFCQFFYAFLSVVHQQSEPQRSEIASSSAFPSSSFLKDSKKRATTWYQVRRRMSRLYSTLCLLFTASLDPSRLKTAC